MLRLCECAQRLAKRCGVKVETAMISDVPGYTWGIVPALAQAGVKYFSIGPNFGDRIGRTMTTWADKPFYWVAPDGRQKVLCWVPYMGYAPGPHRTTSWTRSVPERVARTGEGRLSLRHRAICVGTWAATTARPTPRCPTW